MAKIVDPDNLVYSEYTTGVGIDPTTADSGNPANLLIDYQNKRFALTAPRYGVVGTGSSEMVGYGDTGGVSGQALYSKFKDIWKEDPVAIRFPFPMEAITPESFEFINGWLPDDDTVSTQAGVNTSFISRKLIKDAGWAERNAAGAIQRRYFGAITLGSIQRGPSGFSTVYYNPTNPGIQTSFVVGTNGSVNTGLNALTFDGVVGNGNTYSSAPYFYTGDAVVYQTGSNDNAVTGISHNDVYYVSYVAQGAGTSGILPVGAGHSLTLHNTFDEALSGTNPVALTGSTPGETVTLTAAGIPDDFFFGVTAEGGAANEPFLFYKTKNDDGTNVLYNKSDYFKIFVREEGKTFGEQDIGQIGVSNLGIQAYRLPLSNASDVNASIADANMGDVGPNNVSIAFWQTPQQFTVGGVPYDFMVVIDANQQPLQTVYSKVQYLLRQGIRTNLNPSDASINSRTGTDFNNDFKYGATNQQLLEFIGNDLYVRLANDIFGEAVPGTNYGIIITNTRAADINNIYFYDNNATPGSGAVFYPFVAAGTLVFNDNLLGDGDARFWMFFDEEPPSDAIPGLSTSLSAAAGSAGVTDGVVGDSFEVGAGSSHPFVQGQRVFVQASSANPLGAALTCETGAVVQNPTYSYYVNAQKAVGVAQTYTDITESGTNTPVSTGNRIGVGATDNFRLHYTYSDAIANNNAGINTIPLTAGTGIVTFTQLDVNFAEANATIVQEDNGNYLDAKPITQASIEFTFDYDKNSQRNRIPSAGADASNTYAPKVRVVAVGLQTGQYAAAQATITRAKGQTINVTGALERVYNDPN